MNAFAIGLIDACGGTSAVAKMLKSRTSTVDSWRKNGLSESRLHHLRLAARECALGEVVEGIIAAHSAADILPTKASETGNDDHFSTQAVAA